MSRGNDPEINDTSGFMPKRFVQRYVSAIDAGYKAGVENGLSGTNQLREIIGSPGFDAWVYGFGEGIKDWCILKHMKDPRWQGAAKTIEGEA